MLAMAGAGTATVIVVPPIPEQVIEGHTVFTVIETVKADTRVEEFAAAVAILVRDRLVRTTLAKFPGVTWFNDQYLVDPTLSSSRGVSDRYPCTGSVIAVNRGDLIVDTDLHGNWTLVNATYIESYFITDPNEHQWIVDLWNTSYGRPAWTAAIMNNQLGAGTPDDGRCSGPVWDDWLCTPNRIDELDASNPLAVQQRCAPQGVGSLQFDDPRSENPGDHGIGYPCTGCSKIRYNALLYFRLEHLDVPGLPKDHTERQGDDWTFDAAGCHESDSNAWRCPDADDDREGNSHPYNPEFVTGVPYDGRNNHGGSDICDGIVAYCHATRNVDIYFGYQTPPLLREFYVLDVHGADAPYHCHEEMVLCAPGDAPDPASGPP